MILTKFATVFKKGQSIGIEQTVAEMVEHHVLQRTTSTQMNTKKSYMLLS